MANEEIQGSDQARADELVGRPVESLNVELKTWLDPLEDLHVVKLVRAMFALRNRGGGFLIIGFDDKTLQPDAFPFSKPVEEVYHLDEVQAVVSRYAHDPFEIEVRMGVRDGNSYPVIVVPEGVRTPVAVKRDLVDKASGRHLLTKGEIFFRTLESNGTPSSARIAPADISTMMEICFDNREADIGRFLRRQLGSGGVDAIRTLLGAEPTRSASERLRARAEGIITRGDGAFDRACAAPALPANIALVRQGLTMRVGMAAEPAHSDAVATGEFMNRIAASNPQYTGWPAWLDARGFYKPEDRARVEDGAWVTHIQDGDLGKRQRIEYMLYDPRGDFYTRRLMQDDTAENVMPFTAMDPLLMLYRVTEFIATGISILRGVGWKENEKAGFAFSWTGLSGRQIKSWVNSLRFFGVGEGYQSHTNAAKSYVEVGLDTPHLALAPAVERAVAPLFACFNGYQPSAQLVEDAVRSLVERKL